jgi:hypothetical protein
MEDTINVTATVTVLSVIVALIVERLRSRFLALDGDVITAFTWLVGTGLAAWWDLRVADTLGYAGLPPVLDWIVTGAMIAGVSGIVGTTKAAIAAHTPDQRPKT